MLHRFLAAYVRYAAHLAAYVTLAADPYPRFTGRPGSYPDRRRDPGARAAEPVGDGVSRLPCVPGGPAGGHSDGRSGPRHRWRIQHRGRRGDQPRSWAGSTALHGAGWQRGSATPPCTASATPSRSTATCSSSRSAIPNSDPASYEFANVYRADPIRLTVADDLRRSRLTTFFRLLLAIPHLVWLLLWGDRGVLRGDRKRRSRRVFRGTLAARAAQLPGLVPALPDPRVRVPAAGRQSVPGLHRAAGSYPVDVEIEGPERQNRWTVTGSGSFLAIPAFIMSSALSDRRVSGGGLHVVPRAPPRGRSRAACATSAPTSCATRRRRTATSTCSRASTRTAVRPPAGR